MRNQAGAILILDGRRHVVAVHLWTLMVDSPGRTHSTGRIYTVEGTSSETSHRRWGRTGIFPLKEEQTRRKHVLSCLGMVQTQTIWLSDVE